MFEELLNLTIKIVYLIHKYILSLNDKFEMYLSDKMLHFLVIGCLGMFLLFIIYPLFRYLVEKRKLIVVAWIYVFTCLLGISLLIEIGQGISGTGDMDINDMMAGFAGFFIMSIGFILVKDMLHIFNLKNTQQENNNQENKE